MQIGIADAKKRFSQMVRAVERGETVLITRHGRPVAQMSPPSNKPVRLGGMRGSIRLLPGWNAPIDLDGFL